jgi:hypothetical protein
VPLRSGVNLKQEPSMAKKKRAKSEPDWSKRPPNFDQALMGMVRAVRLFNERNRKKRGRMTFTLKWEPYSSNDGETKHG